MKEFEIRPMAIADVPRVAEVHLVAFPGFFLSSLGSAFLRLFYAESISLGEIACVATIDGSVVGLVMGSARPGGFFKKLLLHNGPRFAWAAAPAVIRRPGIALRLARALRKPTDASRLPGTATLMSIAVRPTLQGRGAGRLLVQAFLEEARARGASRADLTTDTFENEQANAFYRSLGFTVAREIVTPEGRHMNEYELEMREVLAVA